MNTLSVNDLKIGMHVTGDQLSNIYGIWIYVNPETEKYGEYDILYFCSESDKNENEIKKIRNKFGKVSVIYQPAIFEGEDVELYE